MGSSVGDGSDRPPARAGGSWTRYDGVAPEPGRRRGDDRRAVGLLAAPSSTSSRSRRTSGRPRRRPTARFDEEIVAGDHRPTARSSPPTRASAPAARSRSWATLKTPFKADGGHQRRQRQPDLRRRRRRCWSRRRRRPRELGLRPLVRVHTTVVAGDDPVIMLTAPIPATAQGARPLRAVARRHRRLRGERGLRPGAAGLAGRRSAPTPGRLNPHGGAIALGHPLGASGARHHDDAGPPHAGHRHPLRAADDVRGRRHGQRHHPRAARA